MLLLMAGGQARQEVVGGGTRSEHAAGRCVDDECFGGLGSGVDTEDESSHETERRIAD